MLRKDCTLLRCPYCGSGFRIHTVVSGTKTTVEYGTLVCACDEFPVVEGIVYLLRDRAKYIIRFLQDGQTESALQWALFQSGIARRVLPASLIRRLGLSGVNRLLKPIHDVSYYENRLNEPESLLIFLAYSLFASSSRSTPLLWMDVGAGVLNYYREIGKRNPSIRFIAVERSFFVSFLSRLEHPGSRTLNICADASTGELVRSRSLDVLTCLDALPFIPNQRRLISVFRGMLKESGGMVLTSIPEHQYLPFDHTVHPISRRVLRSFFPSATPPVFLHEVRLLIGLKAGAWDIRGCRISDTAPVFRYGCIWTTRTVGDSHPITLSPTLLRKTRPPWTQGERTWENARY